MPFLISLKYHTKDNIWNSFCIEKLPKVVILGWNWAKFAVNSKWSRISTTLTNKRVKTGLFFDIASNLRCLVNLKLRMMQTFKLKNCWAINLMIHLVTVPKRPLGGTGVTVIFMRVKQLAWWIAHNWFISLKQSICHLYIEGCMYEKSLWES